MKLKKKVKVTVILLIVVGIILIGYSLLYTYYVSPVDKKSQADIELVIEPGMSTKQIGELLEKRGLIKSSKFFLVYTKINNCASLKASTYDLKKSMNMGEIVKNICSGNSYNSNVIRITFKEGKRITDYAKVISEKLNVNYEEVINIMNDTNYLKSLQQDYWFLTNDIFDSRIYYPLEGYLAPDTYEFSKDSSVKEIIQVMLDQTAKNLSSYRSLNNIHKYITLASMAELEGVNTKDRKMIVGVFNNRLAANMNLGSDVTTYYAFQKPMTGDLTAKEFATSNPYNTRASDMAGKLPVGPICSVSKSSIDASINPTANDYYYFVADKNGKIYYNKTSSGHLQTIKEIKEAGNWIW